MKELGRCPICNSEPRINVWPTGTYEIECPRCCIGAPGLRSEKMVEDYWENMYIPRRLAELKETKGGKKKAKEYEDTYFEDEE